MLWGHLRNAIAALPFPAKVAICQAPILFAALLLSGPHLLRPGLDVVAMWSGALVLATLLALFLPKRPRRAHWLTAEIDDRHHDLRWK